MTDSARSARVAALWMVHGSTLSQLLRAHGREAHAANLDAALGEVAAIIAAEIGQPALTEAIDWVSDQLWDRPGISTPSPARH
ncbi:MAG: hypothetical protein ACOY3L_05165 [Pseudomonadota bacterium]